MPRRPSDILSDIEDLARRSETLERFAFREALHYPGAAGEPAFQNSWVNFGGSEQLVSFYKWGDRVYLAGLTASGTLPGTVFTLPAGYHPSGAARFCVVSNNALGIVLVAADGTVQVIAGSTAWVDLAGVEFKWGST